MAVEICMNVKPSENVLGVTDSRKMKIAEAFAYGTPTLEAQTVIARATITENWSSQFNCLDRSCEL